MRKYRKSSRMNELNDLTGRFYFNDPDDLDNWSSPVFIMFLQIRSLDFARRYYKRLNDSKSKRRSKEIKKPFEQNLLF